MPGVVIEPVALLDEIHALEAEGIRVRGRLFISHNAHLIMPYHKMLDKAAEARAALPRPLPQAGGETIKMLYHLDCYRFEKPEELLALGVEDYLYPTTAATIKRRHSPRNSDQSATTPPICGFASDSPSNMPPVIVVGDRAPARART